MKKKLLIFVSLLTIAAFSACSGLTAATDTKEASIQSSEESTAVESKTAESTQSSEESKTAESTQSSEESKTAESTQSSEESTIAPASTQAPGPLSENVPRKITLSGNRDDRFLADDFCYVEGEKFFLLLEKDVCVPGDYADNVALIMDQLEKETGLTFAVSYPIIPCDTCSVKYGYNPWKDLFFGQKVPIYLFIDRESVGYISCASAEFTIIYDYNLFSDEVWDSVPAYHDNPWRRDGVIEYSTVAHELTHTLTLRHAKLTKILTEGLADYYAEKVLLDLADQSEDFKKSARNMYLINSVKDTLTPENAEEIFLNDYSDLSQIERQDEYTLGRLYGIFLAKNYGDSF